MQKILALEAKEDHIKLRNIANIVMIRPIPRTIEPISINLKSKQSVKRLESAKGNKREKMIKQGQNKIVIKCYYSSHDEVTLT